jgi:hypothetical protein
MVDLGCKHKIGARFSVYLADCQTLINPVVWARGKSGMRMLRQGVPDNRPAACNLVGTTLLR